MQGGFSVSKNRDTSGTSDKIAQTTDYRGVLKDEKILKISSFQYHRIARIISENGLIFRQKVAAGRRANAKNNLTKNSLKHCRKNLEEAIKI